ncbi:hypothetical protein P280DRAFT_510420 [Massarina eburnea CBS 473.64]|uniref:Geranylgeranyl transferase type II subunit alpha n=1 Tax=Massarina eburnea CBS 473.64 TaxID=1395130 RepID=A0A6A6RPF6_9PLEO|nr:hypothetical protein P280DRAFT_510420 [Massarina eburnea CBS 473.64]
MASHGVSRGAATAVRTEEAREKELEQITAYRELTDLVNAKVAEKQYTVEVLSLVTKLLSENPEYYTVWNYRRRVLGALLSAAPTEDGPNRSTEQMIQDDLLLTFTLLRKYPKCYWIWNHRNWLLQTGEGKLGTDAGRKLWAGELQLVNKMLHADSRNFHAWGYRRDVVEQIERLATPTEETAAKSLTESEFDYTTKMVKTNLSNFSAWHNRSKLIPRLLNERNADSKARRALLASELALICEAINTDPFDQSIWFYHQYLMSTLSPSCPPADLIVLDLDNVMNRSHRLYSSSARFFRWCFSSPSNVATPIATPDTVASAIGKSRPAIFAEQVKSDSRVCLFNNCGGVVVEHPTRRPQIENPALPRRVQLHDSMSASQQPTPPATALRTTCRRAPMSQWRQRGFVQDSDEDDDDLEISPQSAQGTQNASTEHIEPENAQPTIELAGDARDETKGEAGSEENANHGDIAGIRRNTPEQPNSPARPALSPLTPLGDVPSPTPPPQFRTEAIRELSESPDPLQSSLSRRAPRKEKLPSSQTAPEQNVPPKNDADIDKERLALFGLEAFSSDDDLTEPPTDTEPDSPSKTPSRRVALHVLIPHPTAPQPETHEQRAMRTFRERRPIQMHPYLLEGERYRKELQGRGIKPVARVRSPGRRVVHDDAETQDQEFEPGQDSYPTDPLDLVISTPTIRRPSNNGSGSSKRQPRSISKMQNSARIKRRRLNHSLTQPSTIVNREHSISDIWSIPPSPPTSSSPFVSNTGSAIRGLAIPTATSAVHHLPTPSRSSSMQDDGDVGDSDPDPVVRTVRRPAESIQLSNTAAIHEPSHVVSLSDSEPSETELKRVGKRIKGVLPASWLRLNQPRDKSNHNARSISDTRSPERAGPQRGVARKVVRKRDYAQPVERSHDFDEPVVISDDSDDDVDRPAHRTADVQQSAQVASDLAAILDRQYADEDSEDMEDDRLDLFHRGGTSRKRKTQTKLTDAFARAKKPKVSSTVHTRGSGKTKHPTSRGARRTPPPALSVLDLNLSPSHSQGQTPDFLKIAKRQARRRLDLGRQRLTNKHIRLHTAHDTEDATATLHQWKKGAIKPRLNVGQSTKRSNDPAPLNNIDNNQQGGQAPLEANEHVISVQASSRRRRQKLPPGLQIFQRASTKPGKSRLSSSDQQIGNRQPAHQKSVQYRTAQLEGLDTNPNSKDRRFAFAKGLQQVDRQYHLQLPTAHPLPNLPLARFLADDAGRPLPSANDVAQEEQEPIANHLTVSKRQGRLIRKRNPQRVDVDAREYRQPSEPTLNDLFKNTALEVTNISAEGDSDGYVLKGIGASGTRYPSNFDVLPLKSDTYFNVSTFIGAGELGRALPRDASAARDLDEAAGFIVLSHETETIRCGPWDDATFAKISDLIIGLLLPLSEQYSSEQELSMKQGIVMQNISRILRSLNNYFATRLSFLDPIDRQSFVAKMKHLVETLLEKMLPVDNCNDRGITSASHPKTLRSLAYLLVLTMQIRQVALHATVDNVLANGLTDLMQSISKRSIAHLLDNISHLGEFLDKNKRFAERENGIRDSDILVESLVVCMQVLAAVNISGCSFWDLVAQALTPQAEKATHLKTFESLWGTLFTLLPYAELDSSGLLSTNARMSLTNDNWMLVRALLKRLFALYPQTYRKHSSSLNDYVRASLTRCHVLIQYWHWHRCDPALVEIFNFFGKNKLRLLQRESGSGSSRFLEDLAGQPSLRLDPNDNSFQIYLKCLALGLQGICRLPHLYSEKKIRSIVCRLTPNHDRKNPKDEQLDTESLDALRNHHDLLCTLYWASPPSCRPKLELIRGLVHHENSHREACRVNVRAWANLATFQLSKVVSTCTEEAPDAMGPFSEWHKEMMHHMLKQYQLAKTEADDYIKSGVLNDTDAVSLMVRQTMEKNQEQVIATLRDCIAGMRKAVERCMEKAITKTAAIQEFLAASGLVQLLELLHFEDTRLVIVIRDTLGVLCSYGNGLKQILNRKVSQTSEESQDYGDSLDMDEIVQIEQHDSDVQPARSPLAFIEIPLWRLLSNAFGAEFAPDDNLLMECIDTWVLGSSCQISMGARSWSYYLGPYSQVSWQHLRRTEQTQRFGPYFMATLLACDTAAYTGHEADFNASLLSCLADREAMLRFQDRLLRAMVDADPCNPLLQNLPFLRNTNTGELDISPETLRTRRIALISSLLANMRDHFHDTIRDNAQQVTEVKSEYATILRTFMAALRKNYEQLGQGTTVAGAYVEFVQKMVQFLQQYTADICPVLDFFTNSVTFPLPATDPTYVIGRLCGYAPKLSRAGVAKQLSIFIETITQQAAANSQQAYLVDQLKTVLCTAEAPTRDRNALRDGMLQGIFPAYVEIAFSSVAGLVVAMPILQSLPQILQTMMFDMRMFDEASVGSAYDTIMSIAHAFIRSTEQVKGNAQLSRQAFVLRATRLSLEAMVPIMSLLEYIYSRHLGGSAKPTVITYSEQFNVFMAEMLHDMVPQTVPSYMGDSHTLAGAHATLLPFSRDSLHNSIRTNWRTGGDQVVFGHGKARRDVKVGLGSVEDERARLIGCIRGVHAAHERLYGNGDGDGNGNGYGYAGSGEWGVSLGGIDV